MVAVSSGLDQGVRDAYHPQFGTVQQLLPNGTYIQRADITAYEQAENPDGTFIDSNPYGITSAGGRLWIADAAANAVFEVNGSKVSTTAVLHPFDPVPFELPSCLAEPLPWMPEPGTLLPPESVPTQIAHSPDGSLYVATLPGFPQTGGSAKIFRIDPSTGETSVFAEGLSNLTGLDVGPDGAVYATEMVNAGMFEATVCGNFVPGRIMRITDDGIDVIGEATLPSGLAVADDGSVYVSVMSPFPGVGEVWRFSGN